VPAKSFATCFTPGCQLNLELTALCRHVFTVIIVLVGRTISFSRQWVWQTDLHCSAVVSSLCQERLTHTLSIDGPGKWSEKRSGQNLTNLTSGASPDHSGPSWTVEEQQRIAVMGIRTWSIRQAVPHEAICGGSCTTIERLKLHKLPCRY